MNLFGFLAIILICITIVIVMHMLTTSGISIHKTTADVTTRPQVVVTEPAKEDTPKTDSEKIAAVSLDAVIKAANEVMGIEVITKEDNNG
jgi:hypothetical protein